MNLNETITNRIQKTNEWKDKVNELEAALKAAQDEHAFALKDYHKVNMYRDRAKGNNENKDKLFKWTTREFLDRYSSNGKANDYYYYDYESVSFKFNIKLCHRKDLSRWKWEVSVSGQSVYFEDFTHMKMYEREKRGGWHLSGSAAFLTKRFDQSEMAMTKFKTRKEADDCVRDWELRLLAEFKSEIDLDKDLYGQACVKYDNTIRIEMDYATKKGFYNIIKYFPDIQILDTSSVGAIELGGQNCKEFVAHLNEKYKMGIKILAG